MHLNGDVSQMAKEAEIKDAIELKIAQRVTRQFLKVFSKSATRQAINKHCKEVKRKRNSCIMIQISH